jgi:hypothetical protein
MIRSKLPARTQSIAMLAFGAAFGGLAVVVGILLAR